jgi:hypothetical protein
MVLIDWPGSERHKPVHDPAREPVLEAGWSTGNGLPGK